MKHFAVLAACDFDGDGKLEIVVGSSYYEGEAITIYRCDPKKVEALLSVACGACQTILSIARFCTVSERRIRKQFCAKECGAGKTLNRSVMLSEVLQRNAKHEARLSNISICFHAHWFRNHHRFFSRNCGIRMTV